MTTSNKPWIYLGDLTHAWVIVEVDSPAHKAGGASSQDEGGIVGCSEWMWLEEDIAQQIVNEHNALLRKGGV